MCNASETDIHSQEFRAFDESVGQVFQITRLEEAGLVTVTKIIERKRTQTTLALTQMGRVQLTSYWRAMDHLRERVRIPGGGTRLPYGNTARSALEVE